MDVAHGWQVIALSGRQRVVRPEGATIRQPNGNALGYGNATVNIHNGNECKTHNRPEGA